MPAPDSTAVRVALWRALHAQIDPTPHVFEDEVGLRLAAPDEEWLRRPDMDPQFTKPFRASIVARARFIEDLVSEEVQQNGIDQYVILGAGLDTFAQRRPEMSTRKLTVFGGIADSDPTVNQYVSVLSLLGGARDSRQERELVLLCTREVLLPHSHYYNSPAGKHPGGASP